MEKTFEQLMTELRACRLCEGKLSNEPRPIVRGRKDARIMQISQAPSIHVHHCGLPFQDASGKKLRREWYKIDDSIFYDEQYFYITSIGHCYPGKGTNGDKKPPKLCAKTWLKQEMRVVDNELYIIIGAMAAMELFRGKAFDELVFHDQQLCGKKALVLPHPSPLNVRWLKEHPEFEADRLLDIRKQIHACIERSVP